MNIDELIEQLIHYKSLGAETVSIYQYSNNIDWPIESIEPNNGGKEVLINIALD